MAIFTEETQQKILTVAQEAKTYLKILANGWKVKDWKAVQMLVQMGAGPSFFPVGTQLNVASTQYGTLVFDVVAHDHHKNPNDASAHTMTISQRDLLFGLNSTAYMDAPELLWANTTETELPIGTYHFTVYKGDYYSLTDEDGTYQFTIAKPIPVGGGFRHSDLARSGTQSVDRVLNGTFTTYDADCNAIENGLVCTLGSDGTDLGTFSNAAANIVTTIGSINSTQRAAWGSNNYKESNLRQWLNASTANWWQKQTPFDMPPDYVSKLGFLGEIDSELASVIGETDLVVAKNTLYEYNDTLGGSYTVRDKAFFLSRTEVGFGDNNGIAEGSVLEFYDGATDADRIKYRPPTKVVSGGWWLRSCKTDSTINPITVGDNGRPTEYNVQSTWVAPACVIY